MEQWKSSSRLGETPSDDFFGCSKITPGKRRGKKRVQWLFFCEKVRLGSITWGQGVVIDPFFFDLFSEKNQRFWHFGPPPQNVIFSDFLAVLDPPRGSPRTTFGVIVGTFWGNFGFHSGYLQDLQTKQKQLLFLFVTVKRNSKNMCVCVLNVFWMLSIKWIKTKKNNLPFYVWT